MGEKHILDVYRADQRGKIWRQLPPFAPDSRRSENSMPSPLAAHPSIAGTCPKPRWGIASLRAIKQRSLEPALFGRAVQRRTTKSNKPGLPVIDSVHTNYENLT